MSIDYKLDKSDVKICVSCGETKNRSNFYTNKDNKDGVTGQCDICIRKRRKVNDQLNRHVRMSDDDRRYRKVILNAVNNSIRDGKLVRPDICSACKKPGNIEAHHEDYSKPLDVVWLCVPCHGIRHKEINAEERNG